MKLHVLLPHLQNYIAFYSSRLCNVARNWLTSESCCPLSVWQIWIGCSRGGLCPRPLVSLGSGLIYIHKSREACLLKESFQGVPLAMWVYPADPVLWNCPSGPCSQSLYCWQTATWLSTHSTHTWLDSWRTSETAPAEIRFQFIIYVVSL